MGLRTWVKRKFGKAEVERKSYPLRPDPWAKPPQTIPVPGGYANDRSIDKNGEVVSSSVVNDVDRNSELAEQWFNSGMQKYEQGEMLGAIQDWEKAIEIKPDYHEAWQNRGASLDDLGRREEAIESYEKAIEFKPDHPEAWSNRGISLSDLGRYEEAIGSPIVCARSIITLISHCLPTHFCTN